MICSSGGGEAETLWCLSRVIPGSAAFSEAHTVLALDGPAWALTALPHQHAAHISNALLTKKGFYYHDYIHKSDSRSRLIKNMNPVYR